MKKADLKERLTDLLRDEVEEAKLQEVLALVNELGRKASTSNALPKEVEIDDTIYRYCNRHKQYEPKEWFLTESNGKTKPECAPAFYRWQDYGKQINKALKEGDAVKLGELTLLRKKGGYNLMEDVNDFEEKLTEAGITVYPDEAYSEAEVKEVLKEREETKES